MFSAKVKGGVIVAEDIDLPEGATVTVVLDQDAANSDTDELTSEQLAELAEADRDEGIPWETGWRTRSSSRPAQLLPFPQKIGGPEGCTRPPEPDRPDRSERVPVSLVNGSCQRLDLRARDLPLVEAAVAPPRTRSLYAGPVRG